MEVGRAPKAAASGKMGLGWVLPPYSKESTIGLPLRAVYIYIYNHIMNITEMLLSGGQYPRYRS